MMQADGRHVRLWLGAQSPHEALPTPAREWTPRGQKQHLWAGGQPSHSRGGGGVVVGNSAFQLCAKLPTQFSRRCAE